MWNYYRIIIIVLAFTQPHWVRYLARSNYLSNKIITQLLGNTISPNGGWNTMCSLWSFGPCIYLSNHISNKYFNPLPITRKLYLFSVHPIITGFYNPNNNTTVPDNGTAATIRANDSSKALPLLKSAKRRNLTLKFYSLTKRIIFDISPTM